MVTVLQGYKDLASRRGEVLIIDTNTMIHFRPLDDVLWREEFQLDVVRLVLPLPVLDELEQKTYTSDKRRRIG